MIVGLGKVTLNDLYILLILVAGVAKSTLSELVNAAAAGVRVRHRVARVGRGAHAFGARPVRESSARATRRRSRALELRSSSRLVLVGAIGLRQLKR